MSSPWLRAERHLHDLLADRALFGLTDGEAAELEELLQSHPNTDLDMMDRLAARCELALGIGMRDSLPAHLGERLRADARQVLERNPG